jgi:hypothetical protein
MSTLKVTSTPAGTVEVIATTNPANVVRVVPVNNIDVVVRTIVADAPEDSIMM